MKIYSDYLGRTYDTEKLENNGTVHHNGQRLWLTDQAYAAYNKSDEEVYQAHALDAQGNVYLATWETTAAWANGEENKEDESNACDWDTYTVTKIS